MNPADFKSEWHHVADLIRARARERSNELAVDVAGKAASYAELDKLSDKVAASLAGLGLVKGDRVAGFAYNCLELLLIWFGCAKLGVVWVPLNVSLVGNDLAYSLIDAMPRVLFTDAETSSRVDEVESGLVEKPLPIRDRG